MGNSCNGASVMTIEDQKAERRYGPIVKGNEAAIKNLFRHMDVNGNGFLVASELKDVVSKFEEKAFDEKQFFEWFDVHGSSGGSPDAQLDLKEFGWYLADVSEGFPNPQAHMKVVIQKFTEIVMGPEETRYGPIIEGHRAEIEKLFNEIDTNRNGYLVGSELKEFISKYEGVKFDEELFFAWFDVHGAAKGGPDGQLDLKEFGWYIANAAEFHPDPKAQVPIIVREMRAKNGGTFNR